MGTVVEDSTLSGEVPASRRPLTELLALAGPTIAQMASYNLMQFIDTWMLSRMGELPPLAAGNAGMVAWATLSLGIGVLFIVCTLASQSFGRGEHRACGPYLWQGLWFSGIYALVILPMLPMAARLFAALGHAAELVPLEASYLRIVLGFGILKLAATAIGQYLLAINRPGRVLLATVAGVSVNVVAAWVLIFGHLGSSLGGVVGAAWAQNIGVAVELLVLVVLAWQRPMRTQFNLGDARPRREPFLALLRIGLPSGAQTFSDALSWSLFLVGVMAIFGSQTMAANTFVLRYWSVSFMPAWGLTVAVTALVGRYIGMGRHDLAEHRGNLGFRVGAGYMLTCGLVFLVFRHDLVRLFSDDPEVVRIGGIIFLFAVIYQIFDAMCLIFGGALRGAGDTLVPAIATGASCWLFTVMGGYWVARQFPELGPAGPWTAATLYGVTAGLYLWLRYRRGGWKRIHLEQTAS